MRVRSMAASMAGFALAATLTAQFPAAGPEFQVNATTTDIQRFPTATFLGTTGNFVVTWTSNLQDGSFYGIFGRRFGPTGAALGPEFQLNPSSTGYQFGSQVRSDSAGNFVVVWTDYQAGGSSSYEVRARRFDSSGAPLGGEVLVNTYTTGVQSRPAVAVASSGSFVVVWNSGPDSGSGQIGQDGNDFGIFGQRFNNAGAPVGGEFQVNQYTTNYQIRPRVAMGAGGDFIVTWNGPQDSQAGAVLARRYDSGGSPLGGEFQVNTTGQGAQYASDVALDSTGKAIVAWQSFAQDGDLASVYAQRLDASGNKLGPEFNVNSYTTGNQARPRIAVGPADDFTIAWMGGFQDQPGVVGQGVFAQHFDANGKRDGAELPINGYATGNQQNPAIAADGRGAFVVTWESLGQDGSSYAVEARMDSFPRGAPMAVDARPGSGGTNLNGVLEPNEQVTVDPAYANTGAASLALNAAASGLTGPGATSIYTIGDGSADYGSIGAGSTNDCFNATGNCYEMFVGGTRPTLHWDATFDEVLSTLSAKRWTLHVGGSFADVLQNAFYPFIENLFHNGVTGGCATGYCPGNNVTRAQMAVFLLKARYGSGFIPPAATGTVFTDVPASNPFARWIEELARQGITGGCGTSVYCPNNTVTRQQMAVFLLKTKYGSTYAPPAGLGLFGDVTGCPGTICNFIEALYNEGVTGGCQTNPVLLYCPANPNLRQQMAVFLVKTFGLQLYGP